MLEMIFDRKYKKAMEEIDWHIGYHTRELSVLKDSLREEDPLGVNDMVANSIKYHTEKLVTYGDLKYKIEHRVDRKFKH